MAGKKDKPSARALSRLFAVQGLYLLKMNPDATPDNIMVDLTRLSIGALEDFPSPAQADAALLADIINGVFEREAEFKAHLDKALTKKWTYDRLEHLLKLILLAGVYELAARPDIPHPVTINEYVNVAHAFYEGDEPGFVNGILDEVAKTLKMGADG